MTNIKKTMIICLGASFIGIASAANDTKINIEVKNLISKPSNLSVKVWGYSDAFPFREVVGSSIQLNSGDTTNFNVDKPYTTKPETVRLARIAVVDSWGMLMCQTDQDEPEMVAGSYLVTVEDSVIGASDRCKVTIIKQ